MEFVAVSSVLVIVNAIIIMAMLLNVRPSRLPIGKRCGYFCGAAAIILLQIAGMLCLDVETYAKFYILLAQLPALLLYYAVAGRSFVKTMFVMLTTTFLCSPTMLVNKLFNGILHIPPIFTLIIIVMADALMLLLVWRYIKPSFDYIIDVFSNWDIFAFCGIPLLYNLMVQATGGYMMTGQNVKFRVLIGLSTFVSYFLLISLFSRMRDINELRVEKNMMEAKASAAQQKLTEISVSAAQAETYRHDLRHHMSLIGSFLEQGEIDRAKNYLAQTKAEIELITPRRFCDNETVDLLISSFWSKAEKQGIDLSVKAELPSELQIPDTELCSVLSNGLENALHAVNKEEDITLRRVFLD